VTIFDALTYAGNLASIRDVMDDRRVEFVHADICDQDAVLKAMDGHDAVVHFAAESHVDRSIVDPYAFVRTNCFGTNVLCDVARQVGVGRFVHISTDEVYGSIEDGSFAETDRLTPRSPYSAAKAGSDLIALSYVTTYGLPVVVTRCSNNFGPFQFPEKVIPLFTTNALDDRPLPLYASTAHRREWLHVLDHCRAVDAVVLGGVDGRTYNVGSGVERTIADIADGVLGVLGKPSSLKTIVPDRPGHDRRYLLDSSRIRDELGWRPEVDFTEGLSETVGWYEANRSWWEPLRERAPVVEAAWSGAG
jgi:dTDP-glucose 4,6-dehydratase